MNPTDEAAIIRLGTKLSTKIRREEAKKAGKCPVCFTRELEEDRSRCSECGAYQRAYKRQEESEPWRTFSGAEARKTLAGFFDAARSRPDP